MIKILGAALIVVSAGAVGFRMAGSVRYEERCLQQLSRVLELMLCEIPGRLTPVQALCEKASELAGGALKQVFQSCAQQISQRTGQDVRAIMESAMDASAAVVPGLSAGAGVHPGGVLR